MVLDRAKNMGRPRSTYIWHMRKHLTPKQVRLPAGSKKDLFVIDWPSRKVYLCGEMASTFIAESWPDKIGSIVVTTHNDCSEAEVPCGMPN